MFNLRPGIFPLLSLAAITALLIHGAPFFKSHSTTLLLLLSALGLCNFYFLREQLRPRSRLYLGKHTDFRLLLFCFVFFQLSFLFVRFYFSDDSVRHIFDGNLLLMGINPYRVTPLEMGPISGLLPNHPHLPTIYLPLTQLLALGGAWLSGPLGFIFLFHVLTVLLVAAAFPLLNQKERRYFFLVLLSPAFLIFSASRHQDVLGVLLLVFQFLLLRKKQGPLFWAIPGFLAGLLPGLKPDGAYWGLLIFFYLVYQLYRKRVTTLEFFSWGGGAALSLGGLLLFGVLVLIPDLDSLHQFQRTAELFSNWFQAYNPLLSISKTLSGLSNGRLMQIYRPWAFLLGVLAFGLVLFRFRGRFLRLDLRDFFGLALVLILAGILVRGTWNPWYFLWLLPALFGAARPGLFLGLLAIFPFFYLPVIPYRAGGVWSFTLFYIVATAIILGWFSLTEKGLVGILNLWKRRGRNNSH